MLATKRAKELIQTGNFKNVDAVYIGAIPQSEITRTDRTIIRAPTWHLTEIWTSTLSTKR